MLLMVEKSFEPLMLGTDCVVSFPRHPYKSPDRQRDEAVKYTGNTSVCPFLEVILVRVYLTSTFLFFLFFFYSVT